MKLWDKITDGQVYLIAEMSANHAGSLQTAIDIVHAAKEAKADCVKIQTYTADTMTLNSDKDYFKVKGGLWDGYCLYDLYKEASMPWEWQKTIKDEAEKLGLDFLSTPFDTTSVDFLEELDVQIYKIASYELTDIPLLKYVANKQKPIIISAGMGSEEEIFAAINTIKACGNDKIVLLKCTSEYPAHFSDMNLSVIPNMKEKFGVPIGLSDHSMGSLASVVGALNGACVIEKHFCLSRKIKNPDSEFSMEPQEFADMAKQIEDAILINGESTYELHQREKDARWCRRSVFVSENMKKGDFFTEENIRVIRPAHGMLPVYYENVLGKQCARDLEFGEPLREEDVVK